MPRRVIDSKSSDRLELVGWAEPKAKPTISRLVGFAALNPPYAEHLMANLLFLSRMPIQRYEGSCPEDVWTVRDRVPLHSQPGGEGQIVGELMSGETVTALRVLEYVGGVPVRVLRDHGRFLAGDVFYLLDSHAEGFYRVWHYGEVRVTNVSDVRLPWGFNPCERDDRCWAEGDAMPEQLTWARVQRNDGATGWVRDPITSIDGVLSQH